MNGDEAGFLSYARHDDDHDGGSLTQFRQTLQGELRSQTGVIIPIFQDRDDILWGQAWSSRLDSGIDGATILIPIVTPSFLTSAACRKELQRFLDREQALGRDDLIFPLYYIRTPPLENPGDDPFARVLAERQYRDWRENRFEPVDSPPIRRAIASLAEEIIAAFDRDNGGGGDAASPLPVVDDDPWPDNELGFVERIDLMETAFPAVSITLDRVGGIMKTITEVTEASTEEVERSNRPGSPSGAKLAAIRRFQERLEGPVSDFEAAGAEYEELLAQTTIGLRALVETTVSRAEPEDAAATRGLADSLVEVETQADVGLKSLEGFYTAVEGLLPLSSTLRPVLKRLMQATSQILESRPVIAEWARLGTTLHEYLASFDDVA